MQTEVKTSKMLEARENACDQAKPPVVLILNLIGWQNGRDFSGPIK